MDGSPPVSHALLFFLSSPSTLLRSMTHMAAYFLAGLQPGSLRGGPGLWRTAHPYPGGALWPFRPLWLWVRSVLLQQHGGGGLILRCCCQLYVVVFFFDTVPPGVWEWGCSARRLLLSLEGVCDGCPKGGVTTNQSYIILILTSVYSPIDYKLLFSSSGVFGVI